MQYAMSWHEYMYNGNVIDSYPDNSLVYLRPELHLLEWVVPLTHQLVQQDAKWVYINLLIKDVKEDYRIVHRQRKSNKILIWSNTVFLACV